MKEINLKIAEIMQLEAELNGVSNPQTGEVFFAGLLTTTLPLVAKYWINELAETVNKEKKKVDEVRTDLIKKYGRTDEKGNTIIDRWENEEEHIPNQAYLDFEKEYSALLAEEKPLSYNPISLKLLEKVDSGSNFPMFFRFVQP